MSIAKSSPLYHYWNSEQDDNDEQKRLLKLNSLEPASILFKNEPYKWENLYQSVVRNVLSGDKSSLRALMVLLSTLKKTEKDTCLIVLEKILDKHVMYILRRKRYKDIKPNKNIFITLNIFWNIFTNPYKLEIKRHKNHFYEETGMFFLKLRKLHLF